MTPNQTHAPALSDERLNEIEARTRHATDGPWKSMVIDANNAAVWAGGNTVFTSQRIGRVNRNTEPVSDAEFIAHARQDVPALLAEVKRLRTALKDYAEQIAESDHEIGAATSREVGAQAEVRRLRAALTNRDLLINKHRETLSTVLGQREEAEAQLTETAALRSLIETFLTCPASQSPAGPTALDTADLAHSYFTLTGWGAPKEEKC